MGRNEWPNENQKKKNYLHNNKNEKNYIWSFENIWRKIKFNINMKAMMDWQSVNQFICIYVFTLIFSSFLSKPWSRYIIICFVIFFFFIFLLLNLNNFNFWNQLKRVVLVEQILVEFVMLVGFYIKFNLTTMCVSVFFKKFVWI